MFYGDWAIYLAHAQLCDKYRKEELINTHAISTHTNDALSCSGVSSISRKHVSGVVHGVERGKGGISLGF